MNETRDTVLTIGHSTHAIEAFVALLRRHDASAVADVRSAPYSRFNPQFNREPFAEALDQVGIRYVYLGDALGGRSDDPHCYQDGRICYDRVAETDVFQRGLERVVRGARKHRIALVCSEKEPLDCHRTLLVARALDEHGLDVAHVHADGVLESHGKAMERLLNHLWPADGLLVRPQPRQAAIAEAVALQAKQVAFMDENMVTTTARPVQ